MKREKGREVREKETKKEKRMTRNNFILVSLC
jgi:hypothetical protein